MSRHSLPHAGWFGSFAVLAAGLLAATYLLPGCDPEVPGPCNISAIGCQPGDACSSDADCQTGGDSSATCDSAGRVCVAVCGTTSIVSQANLEAARYCREITGDLYLEPTLANIVSTDLPYLTVVRGSIKAGSATGNPTSQTITLANLQTVGGSVAFGGFLNLQQVSFPRLRSVGGAVEFILSSQLRQISLPELTAAPGGFTLGVLPSLTQVDVPKLQTIGGQLQLRVLCDLPWAQVQRISTFGSGQRIDNVGCCASSGQACDASCTCD
jgi:hypothetical protein